MVHFQPKQSSQTIQYLGLHERAEAYEIMVNAQVHPWSQATFDSCLEQPYTAVCLRDGERLQGFYITLLTDIAGHKELTLMELVIAQEYQGQGLGSVLLKHLITEANAAQVNEIWLEVRVSNDPAIHLYKKYGFTEVQIRKGYYPVSQTASEKNANLENTPTQDSGKTQKQTKVTREDAVVMCYRFI